MTKQARADFERLQRGILRGLALCLLTAGFVLAVSHYLRWQ